MIASLFHMFRLITYFGSMSCTLVWTAWAVGSSDPLEKMVQQAHQDNPGLKAQRQKIAALELGPIQAHALPDPTFEGQLTNIRVPKFKPWQAFNSGIMLEYNQVIPAMAKRRAAAEIAFQEIEMEKSRLVAMESELRGQIVASAFQTVIAQKLLAVRDEVEKALNVMVNLSTTTYSAGQGSQAEILLAQTAVTRLQSERYTLFLQREIAMARLENLLGRPPDPVLLAAIGLPEPTPLPEETVLLAQIATIAPEVQMIRNEEGVQERRVNAAKADFKPDWMIGAGIRIRDPGMMNNTLLQFKLGFTLPSIRRNDRYIPALEQSLRQLEVTRLDTAKTVNETRYRFSEAYRGARKNLRMIELYRKGLLLQTRLTYETALSAYSVRKGDFNAVLESLLAYYYDSQTDLIMAIGDYHEQIATMEAVLGRPLREIVVSP